MDTDFDYTAIIIDFKETNVCKELISQVNKFQRSGERHLPSAVGRATSAGSPQRRASTSDYNRQ